MLLGVSIKRGNSAAAPPSLRVHFALRLSATCGRAAYCDWLCCPADLLLNVSNDLQPSVFLK
jgi:hypothetical protein